MKKRICAGAFFLLLLMVCSGCTIERAKPEKIEDIDFVLVEDSQVPLELQTIIEEKKHERFHLSFDTEGKRYIAIGYGEQASSGYSISVEELYLSKNAVYVKTNLLGPAKGEVVNEVPTYPYIIVKTEYMDKSVVFE